MNRSIVEIGACAMLLGTFTTGCVALRHWWFPQQEFVAVGIPEQPLEAARAECLEASEFRTGHTGNNGNHFWRCMESRGWVQGDAPDATGREPHDAAGEIQASTSPETWTQKGRSMNATPPKPEQRPHALEAHGDIREDEYYWLRDDERSDPEVIAYLEAENAYTTEQMAPLAAFQETLFQEIVGRIDPDESTVPYRFDGDWYYLRYEKNKEYPILCRRRESLDAAEQVMIDGNVEAVGHSFYQLAGAIVSESRNIAAYAEDTLGRRIFSVRFRNLETGAAFADVLADASGAMAWAADDIHLFYAKRDEATLRPHQVWRHVLGTPQVDDQLVFEESDDEFFVDVRRSKSQRYIIIGSYQTLSHEIRVVPADQPLSEPRVFLARENDHEYDIEHLGDRFYIRTNWKARDFRLMSVPLEHSADKARWRDELPTRPGVFLRDFDLFERFFVVAERSDGIARLRVIPWQDRDSAHEIAFDEEVYVSDIGTNREIDTDTLRFEYASLTTPHSVFDYDMGTRTRELKKRQRVLGEFDPNAYTTGRVEVTASDGTRVPVSYVHRRDLDRSRPQALLLYGYGSYGVSMDPEFSAARLSLLDRGFIYAIAHVRGGQEYGRSWYEDGKLMRKRNTFTDFIGCAQHLVDAGWTSQQLLFAHGGSAGGLLVGAVANMAPDLFHGIVADVPFVDVVTTMLDESIPLTTFEYDEWGNPSERAAYDYMLSYSPYDNVIAQSYPHMLVLSGLHDSQVQYWEPAKWVARLRDRSTGSNRLLLQTNMEAGHGGASGRFRRHRETALIYAFVLDLVGKSQRETGGSGARVFPDR